MALSRSRIRKIEEKAQAVAPQQQPLTPQQQLQIDNFYAFFLGAWEVLHPGEELQDNWHIRYLCEVLEKVSVGEIRNLLINIQPRALKSELVSVCFPCWRWLHAPSGKWLCMSYASSLANSHNQMRRDLLRSPYYHGLFPNMQLKDDKDRISEFANNYRGEIYSRGLDSAVTGIGANSEGGIICLPYHQVINTDVGLLPIGEIVENKLPVKVATFNHQNESIEYVGIDRYEINPGRDLVEIDLGDCPRGSAKGNRVIECTEDHLVWVKGKGYIPARDIAPNDVVLLYDEKKNLYVKTVRRKPAPARTYNIATSNHNYFADGVLVHNCDDPNNVIKSDSDRVRTEELRKFRDYSVSRKSDPKLTSTIIIQQRVHVEDCSGYVLKEFPDKYEYIKIATRAKEYEEWRSPKTGNTLAIRQPGDLLHPERFGEEEDNEALRTLGAYMYAARHAQEPYPSSGGIFGTDWWRYFHDLPSKYIAAISVDASFGSTSDTASFVVVQLWLIARPNFYLYDQLRQRLTFPQTKAAIAKLYAHWQQELGCSIAPILIEAKANGKAIVQSLRSSIPGIVEVVPTESKIARAQAVSPIYEAGNVLLRPSASWLDEYKIEFEAFPNYSSDDCVDGSSQIIQYYLKKWRSQDAANDDEYQTTKVRQF